MSAAVQMLVDVGGSDKIPHTFLKVTHPDGTTTEYGFAPIVTGVAGEGAIFKTGTGDEKPHEFQFAGELQSLSDQQYIDLINFINDSETNPPYYIVTGDA